MPADRPPAAVGPVAPQERIVTLDVLRGWAVFGIFLADVDALFTVTSGTDRLLSELHYFLIVDKFWPLFSLLFGVGFAIQMERAEAKGAAFVHLYGRRLLVLLLIGVANEIFLLQLWRLDILHQYAIVGTLVLAFRRRSLRTILSAALLVALFAPGRAVVERAIHDHRLADPSVAQQVIEQDAEGDASAQARAAEARRLRREGTYWALLVNDARGFGTDPGYYATFIARLLPLFLLGLYMGRRHLFEDLSNHLPSIRRLLPWGLGAGLAGILVQAVTVGEIPSWLDAIRELSRTFAYPALSFSYAAVIVVLLQRASWKRRLAPLAAVGRMALTNYLFQGLILAVLCPAYGLGLYRQLSVASAWGIAVLAFAVQVAVSQWWLRRFPSGPRSGCGVP